MEENPDNDVLSNRLKRLRLLCISVLFIPATILIYCVVLMAVNSNAGWLKYPLPAIFLLIYVVAGLASPLVGVAALIIVWVGRHKSNNNYWPKERKLGSQILVLGLIDILAAVFWVPLFPIVFFNAGGSR